MKIISKVRTTRLIKNHQYEVSSISGQEVKLSGFRGRMNIKNFKKLNGEPLIEGADNFNQNNINTIFNSYKFEELREGEVLVCISNHFKNFVNGGKYVIKNLISIEKERIDYQGRKQQWFDRYILFEGVSRRIKFSPWKFRRLSDDEFREQRLRKLIDGDSNVTDTSSRNIDLVDDKEDTLLKILAESILDPNRHHLSIVEWASDKQGHKMGVTPKDFEPLLNLSLNEILNKIK